MAYIINKLPTAKEMFGITQSAVIKTIISKITEEASLGKTSTYFYLKDIKEYDLYTKLCKELTEEPHLYKVDCDETVMKVTISWHKSPTE